MDDDTLRSIGELAGLTGLTVKTIRFWSDAGLLPPADRTPAGYRLYGPDAPARLALVRTLRDLGIDLATIRRVLAREVGVAEIAAVHAEALDVQIRTLQLRRAVLRAAAGRGSTPEEMELMHKLAKLSDRERTGLINDFVDQVFDGLDVGPEFLAGLRAAVPRLPDDPTAEQVDAWVELAELVQDADFRAGVRRAAADQAGPASRWGSRTRRRPPGWPGWSGSARRPRVRPVSAPPRRRPGRWWTNSPAPMRAWPGGRTARSSGPGCWSGWRSPPTRGTSGTGTWPRWSAGSLRRPRGLRRSSGW